MKTAAIHSESIGGTIRGELIERHDDGTVTIRFAGILLSARHRRSPSPT